MKNMAKILRGIFICMLLIINTSVVLGSINKNPDATGTGTAPLIIIGRVDNVDTDTAGGYDHGWSFYIIKALVLSEEKPRITIVIDTFVYFGYDGFFGFLSNHYVCALVPCGPICYL
jgi:hypothetical protein